MNKGIIFIPVFVLFSTCLFAQLGSTGTRVSAAVVEPITVTRSVDLDFESVAIIIAGSVELVPSHVRAQSAQIVLPVTSGTFTAASFFMNSSTAYTYKITVPESPVIIPSAKGNLLVRSFESDPILTKDSEFLAGVFVSVSPLNVTVNYN
jgi:hypothetical protein